MRARRALLYVPGSDWRKIEKAAMLGADSVCIDLEDGVALSRKVDARSNVVRSLQSLDFGNSERLVRINPVGSGLEEQDLTAISMARPDGVVIPKVAGADDVAWVSSRLATVEQAHNWPVGGIILIAMIETARGLLNLPQIAASDQRLQALVFGAEDYAADVGAIRTSQGLEVLYAQSAVVAAAGAFELQAIDLLYLDFRNKEGLEREARRGAELGYAGMQVIHPDQIAPVQQAFTPEAAAIAQALRIVQANAEHQASGTGAFELDGKMVDKPIVKAAERVLARAKAAGKLS